MTDTVGQPICAICGEEPATTRDHIPPRNVFPRPRPNDLITIPACTACNKSTAVLDEEFRVFISMLVGKRTAEAETLWETETSRTLQHNERLLRKAMSSIQSAYLTSEGGIITEKRDVVVWDSKAPVSVLGKTVRGLYYYHFGEILGKRGTIALAQIKNITRKRVKSVESWPCNCVANGQFLYYYARANDAPLHSAWLLIFHGNLVILGITRTIDY